MEIHNKEPTMKLERFPFAAILFLLFVSCGNSGRKPPHTQFRLIEPPSNGSGLGLIDSDADRIPDAIETSNGSDPKVANIPFAMPASFQIAEMGFVFGENMGIGTKVFLSKRMPDGESMDYSYGILRAKLLSNLMAGLRGQVPVEPAGWEWHDLKTVVTGSWKPSTYFPMLEYLDNHVGLNAPVDREGLVRAKFRLEFENTGYVSRISKVKMRSMFWNANRAKAIGLGRETIPCHGLLNGDFDIGAPVLPGKGTGTTWLSKREFEAEDSRLSGRLVLREMEAGHQLAFNIYDFMIVDKFGQSYTYAELLEGLKRDTARVTISTKSETRIFFVAPGESLPEFLKRKYGVVEYDGDGRPVQIGSSRNSNTHPPDWDNLSIAEYNSARWYLSSNMAGILTRLKKGVDYTLIYASAGDLAGSSRKIRESKHRNLQGGYHDLAYVQRGDTVTMRISGRYEIPVFIERNIDVATSWMEEHCRFDVDKRIVCRDYQRTGKARILVREMDGNNSHKFNFGNAPVEMVPKVLIGRKIHQLEPRNVPSMYTLTSNDSVAWFRSTVPESNVESESVVKILIPGNPGAKKIKLGMIRIISGDGINQRGFAITSAYPETNVYAYRPRHRFNIRLKISGSGNN